MPAFAGLSEQKRGSQDSAARRASMSDQAPKSGFFGQFFHKYVSIVTSLSHRTILTMALQQLRKKRSKVIEMNHEEMKGIVLLYN